MKRTFYGMLLAIIGCIAGSRATAQETGSAVFHHFNFEDGANIRNMSDNGKWAVCFGTNGSDATNWDYPRLINLTTNEVTLLPTEDTATGSAVNCAATDVTDDGSTVVGCYNGLPAVWMVNRGWVTLPLPSAMWSGGVVEAVSSDGKYAVGKSTAGWSELPVVWDLSAGGTVVQGLSFPRKGLNGEDEDQIRFTGISGDGRYILGTTSFSYVGETVLFILDREKNTWSPIGFDYNADKETYTPKTEGLAFIDNACISPNGKYVGGTAYMVKEVEGSDFPQEYSTPYLLDMTTGTFTVLDDEDSHDKSCSAIDDDGTIYAASPSNNPVRSLFIRSGNYWVPLSLITKQRYGIDFYETTGYDYTGTGIAASADGRSLSVIPEPSAKSYVLDLPESFSAAAAGIDLLAEYSITPKAGTAFSRIKDIKVTFTRDIKILGGADCATLEDEDGNVCRNSLSFERAANDAKALNIGFRTYTFEEGKTYTVNIPAGSICIDGDENRVCGKISFSYTGRANKPVTMTAASPAQGSTVSQINYTTNPVIITFDTQISLTDATGAMLYRNDETEPFCTLNILQNDNRIAIYPTTTQYLYKDNSYRLVVKAGTVTDITGNNPNEAIEIKYDGAFVREISSNDTIIYSEDFSNALLNVMLYDGDKLTPTEDMAGWTFTSTTAWNVARDDDESNFAAVSHSMYDPAGKSDDWMVTPQLYIPDGKCILTFRAQSYRKASTDVLKVIVWSSEKVLNTLTPDDIAAMRAEGKVVYEGTEIPGANEEYLIGDWVTHTVSLEEFAGKNVYVAFVNENEDQSAIFIDDILIRRNQEFVIALSSATTVVNQTEETIKGRITVSSENTTYTSARITLVDAQGKELQTLEADGLSLKKGDSHPFEFSTPLPLENGKANHFVVRAQLNDSKDSLAASIKNLMFEPVKRVTLEEYTGMGCPNCPVGIVSLENLERVYGDRFIAIAYHTYTSDIYESGLTAYSTYLGLVAAPDGLINRKATKYPLGVVDNHYTYASPESDAWADVAEKDLEQLSDADINITAVYDGETDKITVPCTVRYALDATGLNVNLLTFVTEDGLPGYQDNNFYNTEDEVLGAWGKGGSYASSRVFPYTFNDVARAYIGDSYIGTGGYIPAEVTAGQDYKADITFTRPTTVKDIRNCNIVCMMLDANTGAYINAARTRLEVINYDAVDTPECNDEVTVTAANGGVNVRTQGEATVTVYALNGSVLAQTSCHGQAVIALDGFQGMALVRVTFGDTSTVKKVIVK